MNGKVVIFINRKKFDIDSSDASVGRLIELGGGTPGQYELQLRKGEGGPVETSWTDPNLSIQLKDGQHYTTKYIGSIQPS
ncbi:MAG: hypothetical protein JRN15_10425 [Nitrososphaerota archaeon]|nr:hypothetical protein [Nitrososphaerota archaeon]